jgi:hypothetical protein
MKFKDGETELVGGWVMRNGRMAGDEIELRIDDIITHHLKKVGAAGGGWEMLFQDPTDGRIWELTFSRGEMQGGGPRTLRLIGLEQARQKYGNPSD